MKLKKQWGLVLTAFILLATSCKDDNYYTVEVVQPETPAETPQDTIEYENPILGIRNLNYYLGTTDLNPAYILQTKGLVQLYQDSPFVQNRVTNDLLLTVRVPEHPVKYILKVMETDITNPDYCILDFSKLKGNAGDTLNLYMPVNWNYQALASWEKSRRLNLSWEVYANDRFVDTYVYDVVCRSVHDFSYWIQWRDNSGDSDKWYDQLMGEMGSYAAWRMREEGDNSLIVSNTYMLAGFIDEHSPLIDRMKQEVIEDGYVDNIYGPDGYTTDEDCIASIDAFAYLMQKHHVKYAQRNSNDRPYIRGIDEVLGLGQGYYTELACAFASWCINIGIPVDFISMPGHVYPVAILPSGKDFPWDTIGLRHYDYPDLSKPSKEAFAQAHENFVKVQEISAEYYIEDMAAIKANEMMFQRTNLYAARFYMPSFNFSDKYWSNALSRSVEGRELQPVTDSLLLKMLNMYQEPVKTTAVGGTGER